MRNRKIEIKKKVPFLRKERMQIIRIEIEKGAFAIS